MPNTFHLRPTPVKRFPCRQQGLSNSRIGELLALRVLGHPEQAVLNRHDQTALLKLIQAKWMANPQLTVKHLLAKSSAHCSLPVSSPTVDGYKDGSGPSGDRTTFKQWLPSLNNTKGAIFSLQKGIWLHSYLFLSFAQYCLLPG